MMATPLDSDDLVQHRVECDGVPGAVRVIPPANHGPRDTKRRRDGREREGHEDPLGAGHKLQVAGILQSLQDRERLDAVEVVPLHDLFEHGRDGKLQEMIEDVLPHVARERIMSRARHDTAFIRDGDEEPDKVAGFPWHWRRATHHFVPTTKYPATPVRSCTSTNPAARTLATSSSGPWNAMWPACRYPAIHR